MIYALVMPEYGHSYDMGCWADWAGYIFQHGLSDAYNSNTNYLPGHLYEIRLYTLLFDTKEDVIQNIYYLKYFSLFFDVTGALLVSSLVTNALMQKLILLVILLNPSYLHNTMIWGQFDSVFSCFVFASFLAIYNKNFNLGLILYIIGLNCKLQAILFLPVLSLFLLYQSEGNFKIKNILKGIAAVLLTEAIILIPFMHDEMLGKVWSTVRGLGGENGCISLEAANIWHLIMSGNLRWTGDVATFLNISLKRWGLLMYLAALFISLFPLMKSVFQRFTGKKENTAISLNRILIMFSLSALCFFYFNTQMHERYSYPAFLFIAAFGIISGNLWIYGLFSLAYFLNNDKLMQCITKINYQAPVFDWHFISYLFMTVIISLVIMLYLKIPRSAFKLQDNSENLK